MPAPSPEMRIGNSPPSGDSFVVVDGIRTPFCKIGGAFATMTPDELGRQAVNALLVRTGIDPALIDGVLFGCTAQPVETANLARLIALRSGIPATVPALTANQGCLSGLAALTLAYERWSAGRGSVFIVGGVESLSQMPLLFRGVSGGPPKKLAVVGKPAARARLRPAFIDCFTGLHFGQTAEAIARRLGITREEQDEFALRSHRLASAARTHVAEEIAPVFVRETRATVTEDDAPRGGETLASLAKQKPGLDKLGAVTGGNSFQAVDGAVALLVMSQSHAEALGLAPIGRLVDFAYAGGDVTETGIAPARAIREMEPRGMCRAKADLVEIHESFAAHVIATVCELGGISEGKLNVNGGAIALGHPLAASGPRLVLSALRELQRREAQSALVAMGSAGGLGAALWLERVSSPA